MCARRFDDRRSLSSNRGGDDTLGFTGLRTLPKLNLSQARTKLNRGYEIQSARQHSQCLRGLAPHALASTRGASAVVSAREKSSHCGSARCRQRTERAMRPNEMMDLPGGLLLSRQGKIGCYSNPANDVSSLDFSTLSPLPGSLGWPSPVASARLWRVERMSRRKKPCHVSKNDSPNHDAEELGKCSEATDSVEKRSEGTACVTICNPPVVAFSRLRTKGLTEIDNHRSSSRSTPPASEWCTTLGMNAGGALPRCPGGLFSQEIFSHYDVDHNGRLSVGELGALLRSHGMGIDYVGAGRMMELIAGADAQSVDRAEFTRGVLRLVQKRRGTGGEAIEVLHCVFRSYDLDKSGLLDIQEYTQLLSHLGHVPKRKSDWEDQDMLVSSCRKDGLSGPLDFQEFVVLMRKVHSGKGVDGWCT